MIKEYNQLIQWKHMHTKQVKILHKRKKKLDISK